MNGSKFTLFLSGNGLGQCEQIYQQDGWQKVLTLSLGLHCFLKHIDICPNI